MFGHHESAQATVLFTRNASGTWDGADNPKIEFVLEIHPANGETFKATTTQHFMRFSHYPQAGDVINVKYHPKSREVQLDVKDDIRYGVKRLKHQQEVEREEAQTKRDALLAAPSESPRKPKEH